MPRAPRSKRTKRPAKARRRTQKRAPHPSAAPLAEPEATHPQEPEETDASGLAAPTSATLRHPLTVVGVGASAGGLEAFSQLLAGLPPDLDMALVLVQHLAPQHESALPVLLSGVSPLPVIQVSQGMRVEPNRVYVIPPNVQMEISDGELHLNPRPSDRTQYTPIDFFLRSLADSAQDRSIAVILSGSASDGAHGVRDVKAAGGIALAQRPDTAKYDGMPRAAIATGLVDQVLTPAEIAGALVQIAGHPYHADSSSATAFERGAVSEEDLQQVFTLLQGASGLDFKQYKMPTILRRLQRRMALQKLTQLGQYVRFLQETPAEVQRLYQDMLIHVTRFFREPESFGALVSQIFPKILEKRRRDAPIRIWVCGCATGEEAYSVAIALLEFLGEEATSIPIQIFATDVSESAIEHARNGVYAEAIVADVSAERLQRFFNKVDGSYRISKPVRDLCVFARQDLTRDPPFSKLDLILCRNVLIYMTAPLQRKLMTVFHYALKPSGFLMLGNAETIGTHNDLFTVLDKKNRIYARKLGDASLSMSLPVDYTALPPLSRGSTAGVRGQSHGIQSEASRLLLERYAPSGVLVDADFQIVQFRGQTGRYLEPAPGNPSLSLLKMARDGLLSGLRTALHEARKRNAPVRHENLRVRSNGGWRAIHLQVLPVAHAERSHFLVLFEEAKPARRTDAERRPRSTAKSRRASGVGQLEQELAASREHQHSIIQELEAANEELQSANEEILSSNEELQSTNEELDTAKEELQSSNEELNTVNDELHGRNADLSRANSDLLNLLVSVEIAIVMVTSDLRIRRFTPMAERVLNLIPTDVGRPIGHIKPNIDCPDLEALIQEAVERVEPRERQVRDRQGTWYSLRIRPYKNVDSRIEGAVLTLFDIDAARRESEQTRTARDFAYALVETVHEPVVVLEPDARVYATNPAFCAAFEVARDEAEGSNLFELARGTLDVDDFRSRVERQFDSDGPLREIELVVDLSRLGSTKLRVNGRRFDTLAGPLMLLAMQGDPRATGGVRERRE